jgi:hypothetical protein
MAGFRDLGGLEAVLSLLGYVYVWMVGILHGWSYCIAMIWQIWVGTMRNWLGVLKHLTDKYLVEMNTIVRTLLSHLSLVFYFYSL